MDANWAHERLDVIRTLMERSAIYRRALAPVMLMLGVLGTVAAIFGFFLELNDSSRFAFYWMGVSLVGICGAYLLVRKQSLKEKEPFWSPPTRRVTQALAPPLFVGAVAGLILSRPDGHIPAAWWLPPIWMLLYGCAVHAAGFFMPRGFKLFGWGFLISGCSLAGGLSLAGGIYPIQYGHAIMGVFFGLCHLAYGIYLCFTENRKRQL